MDLQDHGGLRLNFVQLLLQFEHSQFDDIGGASLDRRIHRGSFRKTAQVEVPTQDIGQVAAAVQDRRYISFPGFRYYPVIYSLTRNTFKIVVDVFLGFTAGNTQVLAQSKSLIP